MKINRSVVRWLALLTLMHASMDFSPLLGQGTAMFYQGRLSVAGAPANGIFDVGAMVYDAAEEGNLVAGPLTNAATAVSNGLFTVTLDFGPGVFGGEPRWVELFVRPNGGGEFTVLTPRQSLLPAPYAMMANTASNLLGALPATQLNGTIPITQLPATLLTNGAAGVNITGTFSGNGSGLTNVPGSVIWQAVTGIHQSAQPNANYLLTNPAQSSILLPGAAQVGDVVRVSGAGAGGWQVLPNSGQSIAGYSAALSFGETWTPRADPSEAWYGLAADYDGSTLIGVGSYGGRIWISHDYGTNWMAREAVGYWPQATTSADGSKLATFQQAGQIYTSDDGGTNWVPRGNSRNWNGIASSADGTRLAATVWGGQIYVSTDSGVTWVAREQNRAWGGIASSADGSKLAATVSGGGQVYTSTDGGTNWTARGSNRNWCQIASSADGCRLVAGVSRGYLYTSADSGVTWVEGGIEGGWNYLASSADGNRLIAVDHAESGRIYVSADGGVTWNMRENPRYWRQVAVSGDGKVLAAAVDRGYIYLSGETLTGTPVSGVQGATATFQYLGNGQWQPLSESQIATGAVGSSQLASNLAVSGTLTAGNFQGNGANLTGLDYNNLANRPVIAATDNLVATNDSRPLVFANPGNSFTGTFVGNGAGLTNLPGGSAGGLQWQVVHGTSQQAQANRGYLCTIAAQVTVTLPTAPNVGDTVRILGTGAGGWKLAQNAGQFVQGAAFGLANTNWNGLSNWVQSGPNGPWYRLACSSDGTKLVSGQYGGYIFTSADSGATWVQRPSAGGGAWFCFTSSADGTKLAAGLDGGYLFTSSDAGATWVQRPSAGGGYWSGLASSADGTKLVASQYGGYIFTSTDSGATWVQRPSAGGGYWYFVASSADGTKLVACVNGGYISTSSDSGASWVQRPAGGANWFGVASSADGTKLVACVNGGYISTSSDSGASWVQRPSAGGANWFGVASSADGTKLVASSLGRPLYTSTDAGATWTARGASGNWRGVASSADGTRLVTCVYGGYFYFAQATVQTSSTAGTSGWLVGSANAAIELLYTGNGQFVPLSSVGTFVWQ